MALWTPAEITTALWLDAADSSTLFDATSGGSLPGNNGAVARWEDKSGNARHATQSTSALRPVRQTAIQNNLDSLRFVSSATTNNYLSSFKFAAPNTNWSVFFVGSVDNASAGNDGNVLASDGDGFQTSGIYYQRDVITFNRSGAFTQVAGAGGVASNQMYQSGCVYTAQNSATAFFNGSAGNVVTSLNWSVGSRANYEIGMYRAATQFSISLRGYYSEHIVLQQAASVTTRQLIEGYLAWKWGLQGNLPNDHPYKNAAPTIGRRRNNALIGLL